MKFSRRSVWVGLAIVTLALAGPTTARAQEVWTGLSLTFAKADGADWTLPANQDAITPGVVLTRQDIQGLYNIAQEGAYAGMCLFDSPLSPVDTEWAYGSASNWAALTFETWSDWHGCNPLGMVNQDAVVHLISDDIYIDIKFTSWNGVGGGFSYDRAEAPPAVPTTSNLGLLAMGALFASLLAASVLIVFRLRAS